MKEKDVEQLFIGILIVSLMIFFILITSNDFIKNSPKEVDTVGQAIGWYFRDLFAPLFGR
jgi:hypothetical protein